MTLDSKIPSGPIEKAWEKTRFDMKLVNPANKRKHTIIVVGSGLAGASAAATLGELGYNVKCFCFQDSPRRAHSIAAQGGINAAKNYQNDGDSVYRLFYDTVKGGDFRAREANVYRLAQISVNIIDQCVAQGVPFAREYGGALANRSFGGAQVSRTFYARGQTGQQLLLGAYQALERQIHAGTRRYVSPHGDARPRRHRWQGPRHRYPQPGHRRDRHALRRCRHSGHRRIRERLLSFHQRQGVQRHRDLARPQARRTLRESLLHADSPHVHPGLRRLPVQAHSDVRIAAQRRPHLGAQDKGRQAAAQSDSGERARLLSGAPLSQLRQSRAARRRFAQCQGGLRRRPRSWRDRPRRLSRFLGRYCPSRQACDRRALRQPVRHVPAHHRRRPVQGADAHLSRDSLHHGRAMGRLQPAEHDPRALCARRGQLLRSRRQPAWRQRADAGALRRILHHALHRRQLPRDATSSPRWIQRTPRHRPQSPPYGR